MIDHPLMNFMYIFRASYTRKRWERLTPLNAILIVSDTSCPTSLQTRWHRMIQLVTLAIRHCWLYTLFTSFSNTREKLALFTVVYDLFHEFWWGSQFTVFFFAFLFGKDYYAYGMHEDSTFVKLMQKERFECWLIDRPKSVYPVN